MDAKSFSVPYHGDEQEATKQASRAIGAWLKQYPAVRILDTLVTFGNGQMHITVAYENRYGAQATGRRVAF